MLTEAKKCWGNNAADIALELTEVANFRPTTKLPVRHFSIGFAKQDSEGDKLTDNIKSEIAVRIMEEMGYGDCQYFAVAHGRYDPNHHEVHDHDHIHIVANAIAPAGNRITDYKDYYNLEQCLRKIEKEYGLKAVPNSWEKVKKIRAEIAPSELRDKIDKALMDLPSLKEWIDRLEAEGINVRFRITSRGAVQGISYIHKGEVKKGGDVGHSWRDLSSRFSKTPENLELMRSANLKTQSLSIELKPEDRELLTRAANLAMQKLGGQDKFNDKSVQISIVDDVLKVRRLRPNKIVLSAKKDSDGKWMSIGVPNIDRLKDLKILGDVAKVEVVEAIDIEVVHNGGRQKNSPNVIDINVTQDIQILENITRLDNEIKQAERGNKAPNPQLNKNNHVSDRMNLDR